MSFHSEVGNDACLLARRWTLDTNLAEDLVHLEAWASREFSARMGLRWIGIRILSGYRSRERQMQINPDTPDSLHTRCPSLAVDLQVGSIGVFASNEILTWLGRKWVFMGNRWGGTFQNPVTGMPDYNHFDIPDIESAFSV